MIFVTFLMVRDVIPVSSFIKYSGDLNLPTGNRCLVSALAFVKYVVRAGGAFRVIYLATRPEGIYVLHCFQKKTSKTSPRDIDLARQRYQHIGE